MAKYQNFIKLYCRLAKCSFLTGLLQYSVKKYSSFSPKTCWEKKSCQNPFSVILRLKNALVVGQLMQ